MSIDDPIGVGLMLGVAFWAALIGAAVALCALAFFLFGSTARELGRAKWVDGRPGPGTATALPQPAEEGGRLDEWSEDRLDRAA